MNDNSVKVGKKVSGQVLERIENQTASDEDIQKFIADATDYGRSVKETEWDMRWWDSFPDCLKGLDWQQATTSSVYGPYTQDELDAGITKVATLGTDGNAYWGTGGDGQSTRGTKALYKGIFLRGYTRNSESDPWPSTPDTTDEERATTYTTDGTGLSTLLPTWDYPRVHL